MKTRFTILLFALLALPVLATAHTGPNGRYTKEKKIKKEFSVNPDATLTIKNSYGNIDMVSWDENRIVIEVHVKTNGNNEEKVQKRLDEIDVEFDAMASYVTAKTEFSNRSRSWWNNWQNSNVNMEVNYTVKVPISNSIDINNDYGSVSVNKIEGVAKINCDYGKLILGDLMADNNYLNFDYTKNSTIGYMKSGRINADYSSFFLEKGGNIELNADYSKSEFGAIENLNYTCDYGSIRTEVTKDIMGRGDYLTAKLGRVHGDVNINADYGSIRIEELSERAGDVDIRSDYTGIKLGYNTNYEFTFTIKLEYAGLSGRDDLTINKERIQNSDKYYEGYYGNSRSSNTVTINSEYGGVTLSRY